MLINQKPHTLKLSSKLGLKKTTKNIKENKRLVFVEKLMKTSCK